MYEDVTTKVKLNGRESKAFNVNPLTTRAISKLLEMIGRFAYFPRVLNRDRSPLGHKPDCRLGGSSEYARKSMHACHSVSAACRPAETRRRRGQIGYNTIQYNTIYYAKFVKSMTIQRWISSKVYSHGTNMSNGHQRVMVEAHQGEGTTGICCTVDLLIRYCSSWIHVGGFI